MRLISLRYYYVEEVSSILTIKVRIWQVLMPAKSKYTFKQWYTSKNFAQLVYSLTTIAWNKIMTHCFGLWVNGRPTAKIINIQKSSLYYSFWLCIPRSPLSVSLFSKAIFFYTIKIIYFHLRIVSPASLLLI